MKKHTRVLSLLMTLVLALGLLPMAAFATSYPKAYDVSFQLKDGTVIAEYDKVSYVSSVTVPTYRDVETWYCEALNKEVATGETVVSEDFGTVKNVVFVADTILPESFTLNFCLPNGFKAGSAVLDPNNILRLFTVPTVDGASVNWAADKDLVADKKVTLASGQMFTGQDLDFDYDWYEKNPVLNFDLTSEAVQPDDFTVKFIDDNGKLVSTQTVDALNFYAGLTVPAGMWFCPRQNATVGEGDYISGQTLDLDYTWYGYHPVVEFHAN